MTLIGFVYLIFFITGGIFVARFWLPGRQAVQRWFLGAAIGLLLMMWLPALCGRTPCGFPLSRTDWRQARCACWSRARTLHGTRQSRGSFPKAIKNRSVYCCFLPLPLTVLAGILQYTHSIRPAIDGSYHVGQSTYGDLSLHLAIATSAKNASFPLQNNLLLGAPLAYPYLSDTIATSLLMMGFSLPMAMAFTGTLFCAFAFSGYVLLCRSAVPQARRGGAGGAAAFFNGGLGFFYTLSGTVENGIKTTFWDNLHTIMTGLLQNPHQPARPL